MNGGIRCRERFLALDISVLPASIAQAGAEIQDLTMTKPWLHGLVAPS